MVVGAEVAGSSNTAETVRPMSPNINTPPKSAPMPLPLLMTNPDGASVIVIVDEVNPGAVAVRVTVPDDASACAQKFGKPIDCVPCPAGTVTVMLPEPTRVPFGSPLGSFRSAELSRRACGLLLVIVTVRPPCGAGAVVEPVSSTSRFFPMVVEESRVSAGWFTVAVRLAPLVGEAYPAGWVTLNSVVQGVWQLEVGWNDKLLLVLLAVLMTAGLPFTVPVLGVALVTVTFTDNPARTDPCRNGRFEGSNCQAETVNVVGDEIVVVAKSPPEAPLFSRNAEGFSATFEVEVLYPGADAVRVTTPDDASAWMKNDGKVRLVVP